MCLCASVTRPSKPFYEDLRHSPLSLNVGVQTTSARLDNLEPSLHASTSINAHRGGGGGRRLQGLSCGAPSRTFLMRKH